MSDFLQRLSLRTLAPERLAGPRAASLYEPPGELALGALAEVEELVEVPPAPARARAPRRARRPDRAVPPPPPAGPVDERATAVQARAEPSSEQDTPAGDAEDDPPAAGPAERRSSPQPSVATGEATVPTSVPPRGPATAEPVAPRAAPAVERDVPVRAQKGGAKPDAVTPDAATPGVTTLNATTPDAVKAVAGALSPATVPAPTRPPERAVSTADRTAAVTAKRRSEPVPPRPRRRSLPARSGPPEPAPEPTVHVSIGRIEVRAVAPPPGSPPPRAAPRATGPSLGDYLRRRAGGVQ